MRSSDNHTSDQSTPPEQQIMSTTRLLLNDSIVLKNSSQSLEAGLRTNHKHDLDAALKFIVNLIGDVRPKITNLKGTVDLFQTAGHSFAMDYMAHHLSHDLEVLAILQGWYTVWLNLLHQHCYLLSGKVMRQYQLEDSATVLQNRGRYSSNPVGFDLTFRSVEGIECALHQITNVDFKDSKSNSVRKFAHLLFHRNPMIELYYVNIILID